MNKQVKRLVAGVVLTMSLGLLAGCGTTDKVGTVHYAKLATESAKSKEIQAKMEVKFAEVNNRLVEAQSKQTPEEFEKTKQEAEQEFTVFKQAMANEFRSNVEVTVQGIAREKGLTIVQDKAVVISGATDITDDVLAKMNEQSGDVKK